VRLIDLGTVLIQLRKLIKDHRHNFIKDSAEERAWKIGIEDCIDILLSSDSVGQSENCISRQAVDTLVDELARAISDERCCMSRGRSTATIMQDILDLPSVTPQPKVGHWIWELASNGWANHICSKCGFKENTDIHVKLNWRYCPKCGAKMVESEDKE